MIKTVQPVMGAEERDAAVVGLRHLVDKRILVERDADLVRGAIEALQTAPRGPLLAGDVEANALGRFRRESPESRKAALANYPRSGTQRLSVLGRVAKAGTFGATRDELAVWLGLGVSTVNPRVRELIDGGWLEERLDPDGKRVTRPTRMGSEAAVLVITGRARTQLRRRGVWVAS